MVSSAGHVFALYRQFFLILFLFLFVSLSSFVLYNVLSASRFENLSPKFQSVSLENIDRLEVVRLPINAPVSPTEIRHCTYWDCFNVYKCGQKGLKQISVYVYPLHKYVVQNNVEVDGGISKEMYLLLKSVISSKYYTADPHEACIFVPSIDTLNYHRYNSQGVSQALAALPFWRDGENHLIWSMIGNSTSESTLPVDIEIGKSMLAGAGFTSWSYRLSFDVVVPIFNPLAVKIFEQREENNIRTVHMLVVQTNLDPRFLAELKSQIRQPSDLLILEKCPNGNSSVRCSSKSSKEKYLYPDVLYSGFFCLVVCDSRLSHALLLEVMAAGCVPVIVGNSVVMPFQEVLDWKRAVIFVGEDELGGIMNVAQGISRARYLEMKRQAEYFYEKYFMNMGDIALATLDIINQRVFPESGRSYLKWNLPPNPLSTRTPLFHQLTARKWQGFTAVVLTYNRVDSLFTLIKQLVKVPSLSKIIVIWNNQHKSPPPVSAWPKVSKMIKVIQTKANKLSNRFYPYPDIETEAILTIDDDISMLTPDELEFGFEVWREFPDRIVGFPSRTHVWDNISMHWKYESEWTNEISMVLTGAAFHHKIWSYLYTTGMPGDIKEWVDDHMNCEDIAMNFLVANVTGKAPIKVAPRKKFKCPECTNMEMLSADVTHMMERSRCIDRFASIYGVMPLRSVEFRADPVLYKDTFPGKLKRFNDIGSL